MVASCLCFAGLATTFEEGWATLGDAFEIAEQVLRGSPLVESLRNPSLTNGGVTDINSYFEYRKALEKDKVRIGYEQSLSTEQMIVLVPLNSRAKRC
jgi:hypothetical protein